EDDAIARVEHALAIDPHHSWALRSQITFLRQARRFDEAEHAATEALEHRPDDPDLHITAAWLHHTHDPEHKALTHAPAALTIDPRHSWALRSRIDILRRARRFEEAEHAATEALERRPDDPDVHVTAGWLHDARHQDQSALSCCEKALAIDPRHAE